MALTLPFSGRGSHVARRVEATAERMEERTDALIDDAHATLSHVRGRLIDADQAIEAWRVAGVLVGVVAVLVIARNMAELIKVASRP